MQLLQLLEKPEQRQILLLQFLLENQGSSTITEASLKLDVYRSSIKESLKGLQQMLALEENRLMIEVDEEMITVKSVGDISNLEIYYAYLKDALNYRILLYLFQNGRFELQALSIKLMVSIATLSRRIKNLNSLLSEYDIKIKNGRLIGPELQIRYFYYHLFWFGQPYHLNKVRLLEKSSLDFIYALEQKLAYKFTEKARIQLMIWLHVSKKRLALFSNQEMEHPAEAKDYRFRNELFDDLHEILSIYYSRFAYEWGIHEITMFYLFLVGNFILDFSSNRNPSSVLLKNIVAEAKNQDYFVSELNQKILDLWQDSFQLDTVLSPEFLKNMEISLFQIHHKWYYFKGFFYFFGNDGIGSLADFFLEPKILELCQRMSDEVRNYTLIKRKSALEEKELFQHYAALIYHAYRSLDVHLTVGCDFPFEYTVSFLLRDRILCCLDPRINVKIENFNGNKDYDLILTNVQKNYPRCSEDDVYIVLSVEYESDIAELEGIIQKRFRKKLLEKVLRK